MLGVLRSTQGMKTVATILMGLALVTIAAVHVSSQKSVAIQGPGAMQAVSPERVWLGVNTDLWILDASGHKLAHKSAEDFGFKEAISNIALAPNGEALLTTRGDPTWKVVRVSDLSVVRTITPQWPEEFKGNVSRAIHVAVSPTWDIAVATGGGHTVLLFGSDGKLKARTPKDTYYFTNGLWHSPQGWWTTDTNNYVLRLLDSETLVGKGSIHLTESMGAHNALGEMTASKGVPKANTGESPVVTVSRLGFLMEPGYVVDVFPDGSQATYNKEPLARVQDISWLGDILLVVDGGQYQVLRFSSRREAMSPFGDAEVKRLLSDMHDDRVFWVNLSSRYMFLLAATLLLCGIAAYSRHKKLSAHAIVRERATGTVGTPAMSSVLNRQWLWAIVWPVAVRLGVVLFCVFWLSGTALFYSATYRQTNPWSLFLILILTIPLPIFLAALWQQKSYQRFSLKPDYEGVMNRKAMAWLLDHDDWDKIRQDGEVVRETLLLRGARPFFAKTHWVLVTSQRVLIFAANARERRLAEEWPRSAVAFAGLPMEDPVGGKAPGWLGRWLVPDPNNLRIRFNTGEVIVGISPSAVTAIRVAALLTRTKPVHQPTLLRASQQAATVAPERRRHRWHQIIASFVIPGLGQWLQDRFVSGTVFFTAAVLLVLLGVGPVLWAASGPKMHVGMFTKLNYLVWWFLLVLVSAWDTYQFAATKVGGRRPLP